MTLFACVISGSAQEKQIINFKDANFKAKLLESNKENQIAEMTDDRYYYGYVSIDANKDGEIDTEEVANITSLNVSNSNINSLEGIEFFTNLTNLWISNNNISEEVDLSNLKKIYTINCENNQITNIKFPSIGHLSFCDFSNNNLTSVNLNNFTFDGFLDFNNNPNLESIFLKNGNLDGFGQPDGFDFGFDFTNTSLKYVCVDEIDIVYYQAFFEGYIDGVEVNSYCVFDKTLFRQYVQGKTSYCEKNISAKGVKINLFSKGSEFEGTSDFNQNFYTGYDGDYFSNGLDYYRKYTVKPLIEDNGYFTVSPSEYELDFSKVESPAIFDFCLSPNGIHPDLDIIISPSGVARPGFKSYYLVYCRNKGTETQSGTITLNFNDDIADFVSSDGNYTSNGKITWEFNDLKPFNDVYHRFVLELNSPTDTPPLNGDDTFTLSCTISGNLADVKPLDNNFTLNQTVVNSYDPNDKTCLEGNQIQKEKIGDYLTYQIRFENTGTYHAENVIVKDIINPEYFDITTLTPLSGSHNFRTEVNRNVVNFIFEGINLPFEDESNDGFVIFKIKTKESLITGNTIQNQASIYFDYNSPIITNIASTEVIDNLGVSDFMFSDNVSFYPNPSKDYIYLKSKNNIQILSIEIYNMNGQILLAFPNVKSEKIDISELSNGSYILKVNSNKGGSNTKFIKN